MISCTNETFFDRKCVTEGALYKEIMTLRLSGLIYNCVVFAESTNPTCLLPAKGAALLYSHGGQPGKSAPQSK